jgi:hypothetical protein
MSVSRTTYLLAVVTMACLAAPAWAEDLATTVAAKLRESGALTGYRVNVKSKSGTVWLEGQISDERQLAAAIGIAEATPGVERVVNRLAIGGQPGQAPGRLVLPASTWQTAGVPDPTASATAPQDKPSPGNPFASVAGLFFPGGSQSARPEGRVQLAQATQPAARMPPMAAGTARPLGPRGRPTGSSRAIPAGGVIDHHVAGPGPGGFEGPLVDGQMVPGTMHASEGHPAGGGMAGQMVPGTMHASEGYPAGGGMAGPMPMGGAGVGMPPVPMRADGPNMPNYAWPSYAAYPNYAGLQYPTQYSPTAWPYIGPFYPYPQVPLGWRRVSLEWDDGWWWLDFDDRHAHSHHR